MSMTLQLSYPCSSVVHILDWLYLQIPESVPHANLGFKDNIKAHHLSFHFSASNPPFVLISASQFFNFSWQTHDMYCYYIYFQVVQLQDTHREMNSSYFK